MNKSLLNGTSRALTFSAIILFICTLFVAVTPLRDLALIVDNWFFKLSNNFLRDNEVFATVVGYLNHKWENVINITTMLTTNLVFIYFHLNKKDRFKAFANFFTFLVTLEIFILLFNNVLVMKRDSPSILYEGFCYILTEHLAIDAKFSSAKSFPSAHALVCFYWAFFTIRSKFGEPKFLVYFIALLFSTPRLLIGAHWLSDTLFSVSLALFLVNFVVFKNYYMKVIIKIFELCGKKIKL